MLRSNDAGAREVVARLKGLVPDELVAGLERRMSYYDFDGALHMLEAGQKERDDDR